jgi:N-carbamoyl-L-amino-acid hydrolase
MIQDLLANVPNVERLAADLSVLWKTFTDPDQPGFTRRPFTQPYKRSRRWLQQQMEAAGLAAELDAPGNLIGRRSGREALPPLVIGSHTDTVVGGGRFDGTIGVLGGIEVARCLEELGIGLRHPLEIIDFLAEEPTDFGVSCVGSRGITGSLTAEMLAQRDTQGRTLEEAIASIGGCPAAIAAEARSPGSVAAYLELHIEQGPALEREGIPLAAVTAIVGIRRYRVLIEGRPDHAGTTPMDLRRDALVAAAHFVRGVEAACREQENAVATVGYLQVSPNAANVVPGQVELDVEIRSVDSQIINRIGQNLQQRAEQIGDERCVSVTMELLTDNGPVYADGRTLEIVEQACRETAPEALTLISGAGHDANHIAEIAPIGMIFVRSRDGRSHCPEEWTDMEDIALGVQALARAVVKIDEAFQGQER